MSARAKVKITVEVTGLGTWGPECQASRSARDKLENQLREIGASVVSIEVVECIVERGRA